MYLLHQEEEDDKKKKINYGALCLLGFFSCVFTLQLFTFATSFTTKPILHAAFPQETATLDPTATTIPPNSAMALHHPTFSHPYQLSVPSKSLRERPPSSYCLKIQSFKTLFNSVNTDKYLSRPFAAGGYNWTFMVYPKGNKDDNGAGYISLYVAIDNSSLVASPHEVYADLKFFIYNKKEDKYLTFQDAEVKRFHVLRTVWGFSQVLPLDTFNDPKNGYLYDGDHCVFGVDVFVTPLFDKWEVFTVTETFYVPTFTWTLRKFSLLDNQYYLSDEFSIGGRSWNIQLYPKGDGIGEGNSLSLYLLLGSKEQLKAYEQIYVRAKLRILDQRGSKNLEKLVDNWFNKPSNGWGYRQFASFADLQGFIVNDALKIQVEFEALSATNYFPPM